MLGPHQWWDARSAAASDAALAALPPLPGVLKRAERHVSFAQEQPALPPHCDSPEGPLLSLSFDGAPAWASLVPAAASTELVRLPGLCASPRSQACTLALEYRCSGGVHRCADVLDTGGVLESKCRLALAVLVAGSALCPATVTVRWDAERLPAALQPVFSRSWVLKRDMLSNGEGVFFCQSAGQAAEVLASQRAGAVISLLSAAAAPPSDFVLQRHLDAPRLLLGRKFHVRAFVVVDPLSRRTGGPVALWAGTPACSGLEVRLASATYTGDLGDRSQALTNFVAAAAGGRGSGEPIKRTAAEFAAALPDLVPQVVLLAAEAAALCREELEGDGGLVAAADGRTWRPFALLALDVMVDCTGHAWLLEVNRGPMCGVESLEDDGLQSPPYRAHMAALAAALLQLAAPPCVLGATGGARSWPYGFVPLPFPPVSSCPAWDGRTRRQLRPLLAAWPPQLQAGLALAAMDARGTAAEPQAAEVRADLAAIAGAAPFPAALAAFRDISGRSALHAAAAGDAGSAMALLASISPALVSARDAGGLSPLGHAARCAAGEAGCALLAAGAEIDGPDEPLHAAAAADCAPLVTALLAAGASVDVPAVSGSGTPLHWAAGAGAAAATAALISGGASPDACDSDLITPLLLAVAAGHAAVAEVLLAAGADVRKAAPPGGSGATLLHVAAEAGDVRILTALLRAGGRSLRDAVDGDGATAFDAAFAAGHSAVGAFSAALDAAF